MRKAVYWWSSLRHDPTRMIAWALAALFAYLVLAPIVSMLSEAVLVRVGDMRTAGEEPGTLTLAHVARTLWSEVSSVIFWSPLVRTLLVGVIVSVLAIALGFVLGWLLVRTDLPGRKWLTTALILPYIIPSWAFAAAWLTFFKNRRLAGPAGFAESLGFSPPDWLAYGMFPIIVVLTLHIFPLGVLIFGNALRSVDSQLEESAQIMGADRRTIFWKILFPLVRPGVMSVTLLTFAYTIGTFGVPYILGNPVRYRLLSTTLFSNFVNGDTGVVAVLATVMIALGALVVLLDLWLLREYKRFVTVGGGKGSLERIAHLGTWKWPCFAGAMSVVFVSIVAPLTILTLSTFSTSPGIFSWRNFTLQYWVGTEIPHATGRTGIFQDPALIGAFWNSVRVSIAAALLCGVIGLLVGYAVVRLSGTRVSGFLRQVSFAPYLVPSIGFAAAYLSLFAVSRGPIPALWGTIFLLVIAMTMKYLPFASRAGISAMSQLGREPEEAAMIVGAGWWRRMSGIIVPIQKGSLVTGILLPLISAVKELSLIVLLVSPGTMMLTQLVLRYNDDSLPQNANAVVLIIVGLILSLTVLLQRLTGSSLASGLKG